MQGILLVDKPAGWTSFDVVNYVRKMVATREGKKPKNVKVGHAGTLDPFATGLLILLVGKAYTRRAGEFSKLDKIYEVTMRLGEVSTTGDPEGVITPYVSVIPSEVEESRKPEMETTGSFDVAQDDIKVPTKGEIEAAFQKFTGEIEQIPPAYSAIKVNGQRAYKLARAGKEVIIESRKIRVHSTQLAEYSYPEIKFVADVSSGTYIRTLVEDIGQALGAGAYTSELKRLQIEKFSLSQAYSIKDPSILDNLSDTA